ncbi:MAG: endonuclease III [Desulfobacterales bacterium]|nr:endonuclease III [Desulfobacterales bacterium]
MPDLRKKADKVRKILRTAHPVVKTQLNHRTPFELLAATILSAQCTDRQVNRVTPALFSALPDARHMAEASEEALADLIHSTGFFRNKARHLKRCAAALLADHGGRVPDTLEALTALPGVGRKTANVVLGAAFGIPGMVVDTHVARVSRRVGLTSHTDPVRIEFDLMALFPKSSWRDVSLQMVYFGRKTCQARTPLCPDCPLRGVCDYPDKTPGPSALL